MTDIDMQNYAGEIADPAAVDQPDLNSYQQQEYQEYPDQGALLNEAVKSQVVEPTKDSNPQADHFRALREEVDRMKADRDTERKNYELQLDLLRANIAQKQVVNDPEPQKKMFEGMRDDDIPNVSELRKEWEQREAGYQSRLEEMQVAQQYPDYAEVLEKYSIPLVKSKPHLAQGINGAQNKALYAYELGKMAQQMQSVSAPPAPVRNENAQRMVENSRKPSTLSGAGGQGALSKADYYSSMSDADFAKIASRNLDGI
jgi:hypothetical protein